MIAENHGDPTRSVESVEAVEGKGLTGDRYFSSGKPHKAVTLISKEALDGLSEHDGIDLNALQTGRNILTEGIDLNEFVGKRLRIGDAIIEGFELCEPCRGLERRTFPGVLKGLVHKGGLRGSVIESGAIHVGDTIEEA